MDLENHRSREDGRTGVSEAELVCKKVNSGIVWLRSDKVSESVEAKNKWKSRKNRANVHVPEHVP